MKDYYEQKIRLMAKSEFDQIEFNNKLIILFIYISVKSRRINYKICLLTMIKNINNNEN